jgi:hypothetical protein
MAARNRDQERTLPQQHGQKASRAGARLPRDSYDAIDRGALKNRIADAEFATAKALVSSPKKRRLMR